MIHLKTSTSRRDTKHSLGPTQAKLILALLKASTGRTGSYDGTDRLAITLAISLHVPMDGHLEKITLSNENIHNLVIEESFTHQYPDLPEEILEGH